MSRTSSAHFHREDPQVAAGQYFDIGTSAVAQQYRVVQLELARTGTAAGRAGPEVEFEESAVRHRALGGQLEAELHGVGHHGAQLTDLELDAVHAATRGMLAHRVDNALR